MTSHLAFLGSAYACIWALIFFYAWRLTRSLRQLSQRVDELERSRTQESAG